MQLSCELLQYSFYQKMFQTKKFSKNKLWQNIYKCFGHKMYNKEVIVKLRLFNYIKINVKYKVCLIKKCFKQKSF